jgi:aromatic amino acid transport protein AroP
MERGLSNRHIQMIGLGGAIGTGLFLGSAGVIKLAGPSVLIGYGFAGLIAFLIMRQLGEMLVDEPVSGSLSHFSNKYCGSFFGYLAGWNYTIAYMLVGMAELTAVATYMHFWWPTLPSWLIITVFFVLINGINLLDVKIYGEVEFWFALVKVVAVVLMILLGAFLLFGPATPPGASIANLWRRGGFFPNGIAGLLTALPLIMFAFGGLETIGFTAGEARDPQRSIPRAINTVLYRIGIFYIGALAILLALTPWNSLVASLNAAGDPYSASPFVKILSLLHIDFAAHVLNVVVLTAALSVYNSVVYSSSRQLYSLAQQGHAPKMLIKLSRKRVPVNALVASALVTGSVIVINFLFPNGSMEILMSLVSAAVIMGWLLTSFTHLKFKREKIAKGTTTRFSSPFFPLANYLCIAFVLGLLGIMAYTPGGQMTFWFVPLWLVVMLLSYRRTKSTSVKAMTSSNL